MKMNRCFVASIASSNGVDDDDKAEFTSEFCDDEVK